MSQVNLSSSQSPGIRRSAVARGQSSHVRKQATVNGLLAKMNDIHNPPKLGMDWARPCSPSSGKARESQALPVPCRPIPTKRERPTNEQALNAASRDKRKAVTITVVMATASGMQSTNYERTSANSFSKNCFGLAPITVFFTSPSWNR